jgi:hypothetical protein
MKHFAYALLAMRSLQSRGPRTGTTLERFVRQLDRPNPSARAAKAETPALRRAFVLCAEHDQQLGAPHRRSGLARVIDVRDRKIEFVFVPFWVCRGLRCRSVDRRAAGLQYRHGQHVEQFGQVQLGSALDRLGREDVSQ